MSIVPGGKGHTFQANGATIGAFHTFSTGPFAPLVLDGPFYHIHQDPRDHQRHHLKATVKVPSNRTGEGPGYRSGGAWGNTDDTILLTIDMSMFDKYGPQRMADKGWSSVTTAGGVVWPNAHIEQVWLETDGNITIGGKSQAVSGLFYSSHQWTTPANIGEMKSVWRWFYWQLDNGWTGQCVSIYEPNGSTSQSFANLVRPVSEGSNETINIRLSAKEFHVQPIASTLWTSKRSGYSYHRQTIVTIPQFGLKMHFTSLVENNEINYQGDVIQSLPVRVLEYMLNQTDHLTKRVSYLVTYLQCSCHKKYDSHLCSILNELQ
jgi:hypothetical protein